MLKKLRNILVTFQRFIVDRSVENLQYAVVGRHLDLSSSVMFLGD